MFFLRKLNYFQVDCTILELFYKTVLQSVLSFGLVCVFGNMRKGDQDKQNYWMQSDVSLWADLVVDKAERILRDPTHLGWTINQNLITILILASHDHENTVIEEKRLMCCRAN